MKEKDKSEHGESFVESAREEAGKILSGISELGEKGEEVAEKVASEMSKLGEKGEEVMEEVSEMESESAEGSYTGYLYGAHDNVENKDEK